MKTTEFNQSITAEQLNENMFKKFGARVEFDKYTREELENYRNLLRTKVDQHEKSSKFNDLLTNETYQKDKYMLGVLNTKIKEMLGESVLAEKAVSKAQQKFMGMVHAAKKGEKPASKEVAKVAKGMSKKAAKDFASTKHKGLPAHKTEEGVEEDVKTTVKSPTGKLLHVSTKDIDQHGKVSTANAMLGKGGKVEKTGKHSTVSFEKESKENTMKTTEAKMKKAKKDYDGDGKVETEKDEVWGSRMKAAKKAGKMEEGFEDKLDAAREKAAAKGKTKEKETAKPAAKARTVAGKNYGGSKDKSRDLDEVFTYGEPKKKSKSPGHDELARREKELGKNYLANKSGASEYKQKDDPRYQGRHKIAGPKGKLPESSMRSQYNVILESLRYFIAEDEEGKAKDITAGTDMVNDFTSWMQRIGQYQTKSMIELSDSIRANFGQAEADAFKNAIQPALAEALAALTQARETITRAVATLAGEEGADTMGAIPGEEPIDMEVPPAEPDGMNMADEFGAADAASGGAEASGRELRENRKLQRVRKITEAHSILSKLAR